MKVVALSILVLAVLAAGCGGGGTTTVVNTTIVQAGASGASGATPPGPPLCSTFGQEEGPCQDPNERQYVIVNTGSVLHLKELDAELHNISYAKTISKGTGVSRANGTFVIVTLKITNRLHQPVSFDDSQNQTLFGTGRGNDRNVYSEDFDAENNPGKSFLWQGKDIQPDGHQYGTVIFDMPTSAVDQIPTNGNLDILNFSDADSLGGYSKPKLPIGVFRTYRQ